VLLWHDCDGGKLSRLGGRSSFAVWASVVNRLHPTGGVVELAEPTDAAAGARSTPPASLAD
jgi:hypothetical protein